MEEMRHPARDAASRAALVERLAETGVARARAYAAQLVAVEQLRRASAAGGRAATDTADPDTAGAGVAGIGVAGAGVAGAGVAGIDTAGTDASARSRERELALRSLRAEVAVALRMSERAAESLLGVSRVLHEMLPATLAAVQEGRIGERHVSVLVEHTADLDPAVASALERRALPRAEALTPPRFAAWLRRARERLLAESADERRRRAVARRGVWVAPMRDGMAELTAVLPAEQALAIDARLTAAARARVDGPSEPGGGAPGVRAAGATGVACAPTGAEHVRRARADVLADLLLTGVAGRVGEGIVPSVHVVVPVLTLLGRGEEPAELDGYGPIDIGTAARLAADAPSLTRLLTHPETGVVLSVGRDAYRIPAGLRRWLRLRDGTCRFPGCGRAASACDLDHTRDWAYAGTTGHDNLAHLCRGHHTLKHHAAWSVMHADRAGTLVWTSPTAHVAITDPSVRMRGASPPVPGDRRGGDRPADPVTGDPMPSDPAPPEPVPLDPVLLDPVPPDPLPFDPWPPDPTPLDRLRPSD